MTSAADQFPTHAYFNPLVQPPFSPDGYFHNYPSYQTAPPPSPPEGIPQIMNPLSAQPVDEVDQPLIDYQVSFPLAREFHKSTFYFRQINLHKSSN